MKMKKILVWPVVILTLWVIFLASPSKAEEAMDGFKKMDKNSDGSISKEELTLNHRSVFDSVDSNHDGKVTLAEAKTGKWETNYKELGNKNKKGFVTFDDSIALESIYFANADSNHDGKMLPMEYNKYKASWDKDKLAKNN